jgi:NAD-dependent dihydropyrimidine dehydrogenase PreA subunit
MKAGIPRDRIQWFPTINYDACLADSACLDFCKSGVFEWDQAGARVVVAQPLNCVVGCTSCAQICPAEAITFQDKDELKRTLRELRAELAASGEAVAQGRSA